MATPSTPSLRWATAVCGRPRRQASDLQSAALGEHLRHCRATPVRPGRCDTAPAANASIQPRRRRLYALLARAARLIR